MTLHALFIFFVARANMLIFQSIYDKIGRTYLFDIDFWHLQDQGLYTVDAFHAGNVCLYIIGFNSQISRYASYSSLAS